MKLVQAREISSDATDDRKEGGAYLPPQWAPQPLFLEPVVPPEQEVPLCCHRGASLVILR